MSTLPSVISRFVDYYATLDTQPPSALAGIYRADATLIDPFGEHSGVFAIQRYFTHLLANVQHCRFTVDAPLQQGDRFVVTDDALVAPAYRPGAMRQLPGCSVVDMRDDRIVRQRDYYDAGEMIYEHLLYSAGPCAA